jgi:L,D-peptidoglycan transpeptidase YkuD (ErfK/YbiS/YcfS/YnhG family)
VEEGWDLLLRDLSQRRRAAPVGPLRLPSVRSATIAVAAAVTSAVVALAGCASTVPDRLTIPFGDAQQLVVVTAPAWSSNAGLLTTYERAEGGWRIVHSGLPVRLGRNGLNPDHHEGDGTTPAGSFAITGVMGRQPDPGVRYPYRVIVPGDCWISDVASPAYNQLVRASPCVAPNEDLYAIGAGPYRYLATIGYNTDPVVPGAGSAIFLHRHHYDSAGRTVATSGCVSLTESDLLAVLRWLDPAKHPRILMGPDAWLIHP